MFDSFTPYAPLLALLGYPIYLLVMAAVLALCGVPRREIAKWALKQADRQRVIDLVQAARGRRAHAPGDE